MTYFQSPQYPEPGIEDVACNFNIQANKKVCKLRVDFEEFEIPGPLVDDRCEGNNVFKVYAPSFPNGILGGTVQEGLCGFNKGQHLYIPVQPDDIVQMLLILSGTSAVSLRTMRSDREVYLASDMEYLWNLKVTQVECNSDNYDMAQLEATSGCLQYFTENFGTIMSFGNAVSAFTPNQDYFIYFGGDEDTNSRTRRSAGGSRNSCGINLRALQFGMPEQQQGCKNGKKSVSQALEECCTHPDSSFLGIVGMENGNPNTLR